MSKDSARGIKEARQVIHIVDKGNLRLFQLHIIVALWRSTESLGGALDLALRRPRGR